MEQREQQMAVGDMRTENVRSRVAGARLAAVTDTCIVPPRLGSRQKVAKLDTPLPYVSACSEVSR